MENEAAKEWLTATEAGALKGVHRNTIARAIKDGELAAVIVGGRPVIRRADVLNWTPGSPGRPRKKPDEPK